VLEDDLGRLLESYDPGDTVTLDMLHGKQRRKVRVTLGSHASCATPTRNSSRPSVTTSVRSTEAPCSGRISTRLGTRRPMIIGALVDLAGFGVLALASMTTSMPLMLLGFLLIPSGMGLAVPAMTSTVLASADKSRSSLAAAILNTARQSAGAIGVALFGALAHGDADHVGAGLRLTCGVSMALLGAAGLAAARLKGVPPQA